MIFNNQTELSAVRNGCGIKLHRAPYWKALLACVKICNFTFCAEFCWFCPPQTVLRMRMSFRVYRANSSLIYSLCWMILSPFSWKSISPSIYRQELELWRKKFLWKQETGKHAERTWNLSKGDEIIWEMFSEIQSLSKQHLNHFHFKIEFKIAIQISQKIKIKI